MSHAVDTTRTLETARAAALAGGEIARAKAGIAENVITKSATMDLVTEVDVASGVEIVRTILEREPDAAVVVEEPEVYGLTGAPQGDLRSGRVWVIDPIDGTTSFVHGYPFYSISVACIEDGTPIAGAVYHPSLDELFSAERGAGAWLGDSPIRCSEVSTIDRALLGTGFPYDRGVPLARQLAILARVLRTAHDIRRDGSAALDLCYAACGRTDGFWELTLRPWDTAAGAVIAEEAGCVFTDLDGHPWSPEAADVVVANPTLHAELLHLIQMIEEA